ncbi:MAG TPA: hypothetical protein VFB04_03160 [Terriglobales bacterium]|nr:hypothetical protein [Terriglobales bacterium]
MPRSTGDIDIVIASTQTQLHKLIEQFPSSDYYADEQQALEAVASRSQFSIIDFSSGWKVDFIIAETPNMGALLSLAADLWILQVLPCTWPRLKTYSLRSCVGRRWEPLSANSKMLRVSWRHRAAALTAPILSTGYENLASKFSGRASAKRQDKSLRSF